MHTKIHAPTYYQVFKSIDNLGGDCGIDRCHYAVPVKGILIRSTPEIVLSSLNETNYKKAKMKGGLSSMTTVIVNELAPFLMGTIFLALLRIGKRAKRARHSQVCSIENRDRL